MAPLYTILADASVNNDISELRPRHSKQKRSTTIPVQNPSSVTAVPSDPLIGTLTVSLPSGRVLDVLEEECSGEFKLGQSVHPGENLLQKLDGKGSHLLTLQAFAATSKAHMFARLKFGEVSKPCSFVCEFVADALNAANRIATIRISSIQFATKAKSGCDGFITRHNASCNIFYLDAKVVPYLARFPSEQTGTSLFSIIHAEDAQRLEAVHRDLRAGVKLVRTDDIRLVAQDGRVWRTHSEWAAFTNPWSNVVEMVVAKHRFVEMVGQFDCLETLLLTEEQCRQYDSTVRLILEHPPEFGVNEKGEKLETTNLISSGAVSPPLTKNSEDSPQSLSPDLLLSYNQINCLENVHRLLKSQNTQSNQKGTSASAVNENHPAPLTRELLHQHDAKFEFACKTKWHRRLQMKRAVSSSNASTVPEVIPSKVARTEPTSPSATNATSLFLSLLIEQQRRLQTSSGQVSLFASAALSNLLTQHTTTDASTPSNL